MKFFPQSGLIFILAFCTQIGLAQTAIVLINEKPTRVKLEDGEITAVYNEVPNYMDGYEKAPEDAFKKLPLQRINNDIEVVAQPAVAVADTESDSDIEIDAPEKPELEPSVYFEKNSAILTDESLATIQAYATRFKDRSNKSILLKAWYRSGDERSQELVENRLDACRAYLETNGVASNIILTSLIGSNRESKFVSVILN